VGQQPNIRLGIEDLPRPEAHPAAPRRWSPRRPGELGSPAEVPWGGAFGTPGPDAGYAMTVLASREIPAGPGEDRHDVAAALAALMAARASRFGRAPVAADADVAEILLGYRADGLGEAIRERLAALRRRLLPGFAHAKHRGRDLVAAYDREVLIAPSGDVPGLLDTASPA
jgi:hypothetical protein